MLGIPIARYEMAENDESGARPDAGSPQRRLPLWRADYGADAKADRMRVAVENEAGPNEILGIKNIQYIAAFGIGHHRQCWRAFQPPVPGLKRALGFIWPARGMDADSRENIRRPPRARRTDKPLAQTNIGRLI